MKIKAILEGILVGAISAILSYYALISPATVAAIAMRRKMPDAWLRDVYSYIGFNRSSRSC
jgi:hypothetical protein